jgi:L-rhamnose-H+ transport protein
MSPNPFLGVVYHWAGGLAAASFYIPFRAVKRWSWETYWLVGGLFSWILAPWWFAWLLVPDPWGAIRASPGRTLAWTYLFGALWGFGGLTFGLTVRYLGIALGVAVALGLCNALGTLVPPIVSGQIIDIANSSSGRLVLAGVAVCLAGIGVSGAAGMSKERELSAATKQAAIPEFDFTRGMVVATFSGVMSACFAYALAAAKPLSDIARVQLVGAGRSDLWQNLPALVVVLAGGFTTNFVWCVILNARNGSAHEYVRAKAGPSNQSAPDASPLASNYLFSALAGVTWYLQFFFYSMGETQMGKYGFSSWTLHMASIIIFSTLWGIGLKEWKGSSVRTHVLIGIGLAILVGSTLVVGYGNYIKAAGGPGS